MNQNTQSEVAGADIPNPSWGLAQQEPLVDLDWPWASDVVPSWESVRSQFVLEPDWADFTSFMLSSHPCPLRQAIQLIALQIDKCPEWAELSALVPGSLNRVMRAKSALARYLGGDPNEFALAQNTTSGLALVYNGMDLQRGDRVLISDHDHYSHHASASRKCEKSGAEIDYVSLYDDPSLARPDDIIDHLVRALTPQTRVVGLTWVHSGTGVGMPCREASSAIKAWADSSGVEAPLIVVDGAHGVGVFDIDLPELGADFIISGLHKWLNGPRGTGFIWGSQSSWKRVHSTIPSFELDETIFSTWARRQPMPAGQASYVSSGGYVAYEYLFAIPTALRFLEQIGRTRITQRVHALNQHLRDGLAETPSTALASPQHDALNSGIVCFDVVGRNAREVTDRLASVKIRAGATPYPRPYARLAATMTNSEEQIEAAIAAVAQIAGGSGPQETAG